MKRLIEKLKLKINSKVSSGVLLAFVVFFLIVDGYLWWTIRQPEPPTPPMAIPEPEADERLPYVTQGKVKEISKNEFLLETEKRTMKVLVMDTTMFYDKTPDGKDFELVRGGFKNMKVNQKIMIIYKIIGKNLFLAEEIWLSI